MAKRLHEHFLRTREEFLAARAFWQEIVDRVTALEGQGEKWPQWISDTKVGGDPIDIDLLPIISGWSLACNRAFQIVQTNRRANNVTIAAWIREYDPEFHELPAAAMFIGLSISQETADLAEKLLAEWVKPGTTPAVMREVIDQLLPAAM